jgi:hypothetical protein
MCRSALSSAGRRRRPDPQRNRFETADADLLLATAQRLDDRDVLTSPGRCRSRRTLAGSTPPCSAAGRRSASAILNQIVL